MIPQTALVVPIYLLLARAGLIDNPLGVILPTMVSPIGVYLMRVYIDQGVDDALLDAARIDGAGEFRIFRSIVFRLVTPAFVTVLLLAFVAAWNNYFLPLIVLSTPEYYPLTVGLSSWYQLASAGGGGQALFSIVLAGGLFVFMDSLQMGDKPGWDGMLEAFPHRFNETYYRHYAMDDLDGMFSAAGLALRSQSLPFLSKLMVRVKE